MTQGDTLRQASVRSALPYIYGVRSLWHVILFGLLPMTGSAIAAELPVGLASPDHGVVCNASRGMCFDHYGVSIGLTEAFLGASTARALAATLRDTPPAHGPGTEFSPGESISCRWETGPCRINGVVDEALTSVLYGPGPAGSVPGEVFSIIGVDWRWLQSRYNNDTDVRPADPTRYRLQLASDGSLHARVDCNQAGGRHRIEDHAIAIELTHRTTAACPPGSLDRVFLRDLSQATHFIVRDGKLYLDLKDDTGTMEFGDP